MTRGPLPQFATCHHPLAQHLGVRVNGEERSDVLSYSVPHGWAKVGVRGQTGVRTLRGVIEPYWRS